MVRTLIGKGADPDMRGCDLCSFPLWEAACAGDLEMVRLLVESGATPNLGEVVVQAGVAWTDEECAVARDHQEVVSYYRSL